MAVDLISRRRLIGSLPAAFMLTALPALAQKADDQLEVLRPLVGRWRAEEIRGTAVDEFVRSILVIEADGRLSGTGGCNTFRGAGSIDNGHLRFHTRDLVTTLKACTPDFSGQDERFHDALELTRSFALRPLERKLTLLGREDEPLMRLARL